MLSQELIAEWDTTKWLVLTSLSFMFPSIYAFFYQLYFYSFVLSVTSMVSANFWRKATYSWRREIDLVVSKLSFLIFLINAIIYIKCIVTFIIASVNLYLICLFYLFSIKHFKIKNKNWLKYHILFHLCVTLQSFIILDSIIQFETTMKSVNKFVN